MSTVETKIMPVSELTPFPVRELRPDVLEKLEESIRDRYNPARALAVVRADGEYLVADGNHRLRVLQDLEEESVPCVIYEDADPYTVAVESNKDEDTYASMDLFDWLNLIGQLKEKGLTQAEIGERIEWSREQVKNYVAILKKIGTEILDMAKKHQEGRVPSNGTPVPTFDFTEYWFRTSGLYDLTEEYQKQFMEEFKKRSFKWDKAKVQKEAAKYRRWQEFRDIAEEEVVDPGEVATVVALIEKNIFDTEPQCAQR